MGASIGEGFRPLETRPSVIRPEDLTLVERAGARPPVVAPEISGTEAQNELADILNNAITKGESSVAKDIHETPAGQLRGKREVPKVEISGNEIHFKGHIFQLDSRLQVHKDATTGELSVKPARGTFAMSAKDEQAAAKATAAGPHQVATVFHEIKKPPKNVEPTIRSEPKTITHDNIVQHTEAKQGSDIKSGTKVSTEPEHIQKPLEDAGTDATAARVAAAESNVKTLLDTSIKNRADTLGQDLGSRVAAGQAVGSAQAGKQGQEDSQQQQRRDAQAANVSDKLRNDLTKGVTKPAPGETPGGKNR